MKFFLDTADIKEIKELINTGWVDGITTNPSLIRASGRQFIDVIAEICEFVSGPVSAEVISTDYDNMIQEGRKLAKIAPNVVIKVPLTLEGLKVCRTLTDEGTQVNVTLCFSSGQAILAAKSGAAFISPFIGRLDDIGFDGVTLIQEICQIYSQYPEFETKVLAASIRNPVHITQVAQWGADIVTVPPPLIYKLLHHPLTEKGIDTFTKDWQKTGQSIL